MKDQEKTKAQLIEELRSLRRRLTELEASTAGVAGGTDAFSTHPKPWGAGPRTVQEPVSEQSARQAQRVQSVERLAGGVAHEFNNLLTTILGYTKLGLATLSPVDPAGAHFREVLKAGERAASLTRQLLAYSRQQTLEPRLVNLDGAVRELQGLLEQMLGESCQLIHLPTENLGLASVDPQQLEQVLLNLAANARDAMPQGGKLIIETANAILDEAYAREHTGTVPGPYVLLSITDTGVGLSEEAKAHLFEPFFTTKEKGRGTGLGLATCFGIVKQSGGDIWVRSEPDRGTRVEICLPRVPEAGEVRVPSNERESLPSANETILLVEDDASVRQLTAYILRDHGYTVLEAGDGVAALELAQERGSQDIHLLLTDLVMPRMDGKDLACRFRCLRPGTRVLLTSGYTGSVLEHLGVDDLGVPFLQKPSSPQELLRRVREVLSADPPPEP